MPDTHLADIARLNSLYVTSRKQIEIAHQLDPEDPDIRGEWIGMLPLQQRIAELEAYLSAPWGDDEEDTRRGKLFLEHLKRLAAEPHKACHLVSSTGAAEIPFALLMRDATHIRAFGLEIKLNHRTARLQIDTGTGGLLVSRSVAEHAGLKPFSETEMGGIGDQGYKLGYTAYADSIHIGNLEFQDCSVSVLNSRSVIQDVDGLIGMDVFSQFLVTLDFPLRKLLLGPLPPRPEEAAQAAPALKAGDTELDDSENSVESGKAERSKPSAQGADSSGKSPVNESGGGTAPQVTAVAKPSYFRLPPQ